MKTKTKHIQDKEIKSLMQANKQKREAMKQKQRNNAKKRKANTEKNTEEKTKKTGKKLKVLIAGDSNLRNANGEMLSNEYREVEVRFKLGMKVEETSKRVKEDDDFDVIIAHAGTNNLKEKKPEGLTETIVSTITKVQKSNKNVRLAYLSMFKRNDNQALNTKASRVNEVLKDELSIPGIDIIDNQYILK